MKEIIKKYNLKVVDGDKLSASQILRKHKDDEEFVKSHKQEIIRFIKAEEEAARKAAAERRAKIDSIPGLKELQTAIHEHQEYNYEFSKFIENDAIGKCPAKPTSDIGALKSAYPRAAAYIEAESYMDAAHYVKASAGKKAKERIINGDDPETVIADMESEWKNYCDEHIWD